MYFRDSLTLFHTNVNLNLGIEPVLNRDTYDVDQDLLPRYTLHQTKQSRPEGKHTIVGLMDPTMIDSGARRALDPLEWTHKYK